MPGFCDAQPHVDREGLKALGGLPISGLRSIAEIVEAVEIAGLLHEAGAALDVEMARPQRVAVGIELHDDHIGTVATRGRTGAEVDRAVEVSREGDVSEGVLAAGPKVG
ncbi:MAG: hypothetical protein IH919_02025 [Deltaproteobacteria bacterium]|nr:hypothetical protein [Deltaproteobacteria bacterium]